MIEIYTDGSGDNIKKNGGYGYVLIYQGHEKYVSSNKYINTTSARMEIRGILAALREITNKTLSVKLYCDNIYCVKAIAEKWAEKWEREDWIHITTKDGKRVNFDLWKQVLEEVRKFTIEVLFIHVKGHNGTIHNEIADILASEARKSKKIINDIIIHTTK